MAPTKILDCSHGQALLFKHTQSVLLEEDERYVNSRLLDL